MILAIGVAAIVLIAINAVLFAALRLRNATSDAVDAATPLDQTVTFLRRDLQCAMTPTNGTTKVLSGDFRVGNVTAPAWPNRWPLKCSPRPARWAPMRRGPTSSA